MRLTAGGTPVAVKRRAVTRQQRNSLHISEALMSQTWTTTRSNEDNSRSCMHMNSNYNKSVNLNSHKYADVFI
jgi:hypothetical protein